MTSAAWAIAPPVHNLGSEWWCQLPPPLCIAVLRSAFSSHRETAAVRKSGAWRFDGMVPRTHDARAFDSDDDDGVPGREQGSTSSITQNDQYGVEWDDIDGAQSPAMEAARLLHTARQGWWTCHAGG